METRPSTHVLPDGASHSPKRAPIPVASPAWPPFIIAVPPPLTIAVCGAGEANPQACALAEEVGRALAMRGVRVVCGGLGGVMEAVCRGAKSAGGMTIGILPGRDTTEANEWVEVAIPTGLGDGRNLVIIYVADGVFALPGKSGTLSEIAFALKNGKPVVDLGGWGIPGMIPGPADPEQAVESLLTTIRHRGTGP